MIRKKILFAALLLMNIQFTQAQGNLKSLRWLIGHWEGSNNGALFYEKWEWLDSAHLHQVNYLLSGADTIIRGESVVFADTLENRLVYEGSNGYRYWSVELTDTSVVFENPRYNEKMEFSVDPEGRWVARLTRPGSDITYHLRKIKRNQGH